MSITATGFIPDSVLENAIEGALKQNPGQLVADNPSWGTIVTNCNAYAYAKITETFLQRGFTLAQIQTWDNGATYQKKIGMFLALEEGAGLHPEAAEQAEKYKWYFDDLPDVMLIVGGTIT